MNVGSISYWKNSMFKVGDKITFGFYVDLTIMGEDEKHYIVQDCYNHKKKIYKALINKHAKLAMVEAKR